MADETIPFPWPRKGDRPFIPPKPGTRPVTSLSSLHGTESMLEYEFCEGYYEAGVTLAHRFRNDEGIDRPRPGMALPMLFCFRHYLELSLKSLCVQCACLVDEESPERLTNEHGLMPLWNTAKELIQRAFPTLPVDSDDPHPRVESCLNDFHQVDSSSQTFRYCRDKAGKPVGHTLPEIDFPRLVTTMSNLHGFFNGCAMYADQLLDVKSELESQWEPGN